MYITSKSKLKHTIKQFRKENKNSNCEVEADGLNEKQFVPPIYNIVSSNSNQVTWRDYSVYNRKYGRNVPSVKAVSVSKALHIDIQ